MSLECPRCLSTRIGSNNYGEKTAGVVGAGAGTVGGVSNTLAVAVNGAGGAVKVKHSTEFDAEAVKKQLGISVSAWDEFMVRLKNLSERKVRDREAQDFYRELFTDIPGQPAGKTNERAMKQSLSLFEGNGTGSQLASFQGTAYGLVNAVTEFIDHERRAKSVDHRLDSAWFGNGAAIKERAFDKALQLVA